MDSQTTMLIVVAAAPYVGGAIWGIFRWSAARNIAHEDAWKLGVEAWKKGVDGEIAELKKGETARTIAFNEVRGEVQQVAKTLGGLTASMQSLLGTFEQTREKQAEFYRTELAKFEQTMRQELSRVIHPEMPEKVTKLEMRLTALEAKRRKS